VGPRPLALVADDEPSVRGLVCEVLGHAGFETMTAEDGVELLHLAELHRPRLIVVDVMMPRMDGYTTIARLRGRPGTAAIPVIVITGRLDPAFDALSAGVGATAHLTKPFAPATLLATARRLVEDASA
jgi:CheY-like chemotaxis protein